MTPAVLVENASRPDERHGFGTLGNLAALLADDPPVGPALVLIGQVVALADNVRQPVRIAA